MVIMNAFRYGSGMQVSVKRTPFLKLLLSY